MASERAATITSRNAAASSFKEAFPRTMNAWRANIVIAELEEIAGGVLTPELIAPAMHFDLLAEAMEVEADALLSAGLSAGADLAPRFASVSLFPPADFLTLASEKYIADNGARLVSLIDDGARAGLQQSISAIVRGDLTAGEAAIRIGRQAGFTARNVVSINNFEASLAEQFVFGDAPLTDAALRAIDQRVTAYETRILKHRGDLIASTETQAAIHAGEREYWAAALDADGAVVTRSNVTKVWHIVGAEVCPICLGIPVDGVGFDDFFVSASDWTGMHPPAHARCKCYVEYRVQLP